MIDRVFAALSIASLVFATTAHADEPAPSTATGTAPPAPTTPTSPGDKWVVDVNPRIWYVAFDGELTLPGVPDEVDLDARNLDHTTLQPMGQLDIQADRFLFTFNGGTVGSQSSNANLDLQTFNLTAGYKAWQYDFDPSKDAPASSIFRLWLLGGVRLGDLDSSVAFPAGKGGRFISEGDVQWVDIIGGARAELQIADQFFTTFEINAGALSDSFSLDVMAGFTWRPEPWFGVQIGYRYLYIDVEDGDGSGTFGFTGSAAGLFAGASFRF